jgi:hypothetical protein
VNSKDAAHILRKPIAISLQSCDMNNLVHTEPLFQSK